MDESQRPVRPPVDAAPDFGTENGAFADDEQTFRLLVKGVVDYAIYMLHPDGRVANWNAGAERAKGYAAEEIVGQYYGCFYPAEAREAGMPQRNLEAARRNGTFSEEGWRLRKDGSQFWASVVIDALYDDGGRVIGFAKITRDITQQKTDRDRLNALLDAQARSAKDLERAVARATDASRAKSAFLTTMSHEIRTPLNGVLGMAEVMARDDLSEPQRERLEIIRKSGAALLTILNDILDLSRIEAGRMELSSEPFDLALLIGSAVSAFSALAREKVLELTAEIEPEAEAWYFGDAVRIRQVVTNLVSNAIKFTETGSVSITARRGEGGVGLEIEVADTGIGLTAEECGAVFETFVQVDSSLARRFGGSGLGLSISRELARAMGGDIHVAAEVGKGSAFTVILPLERAAAEAPAAAPEAADPATRLYKGARILLAEDNVINRMVVEAVLAPTGADLVSVTTGLSAVKAWREREFDIVLMDVQMPEMDGIAASREIRRSNPGVNAPDIPIIALTANAMEHQVREYLDAGMDACVTKPISVEALFGAIDAALASRA